MIDFHVTIVEGGTIWFVLWCLFWVFLGLYISIKERN